MNIVIDPYDVFGAPRIPGLNAFKSAAKDHSILTKEYQVGRVRPRVALIGASTVDIGLDPEGAYWPAEDQPVFNFGVGATLPDWQFRSL